MTYSAFYGIVLLVINMLDILNFYSFEDFENPLIANIDSKSGNYVFIHFLEATFITVKARTIRIKQGDFLIYEPTNKDIVFSAKRNSFNAIIFSGNLSRLLEDTGLKINKVYRINDSNFLTKYIKDFQTEYYNSRQHRKRLLSLMLEDIILRLSRESIGEILHGTNSKSVLLGFDFNNIWQTSKTYPTLAVFAKDRQKTDIWSGKTKSPDGKHIGSNIDPILIETAEELAYIISVPHEYMHYRITKDIYLNDINKLDWSTGKSTDPYYTPKQWYARKNHPMFSGVLDGDGHVIYGLYYDNESTYDRNGIIGAGLIPIMGNAIIKNIGIEFSYLRYYDNFSLGAIIGRAHRLGNGKISNCYVGSTVTVSGHDSGGIAGGGDLGPNNKIIIENCYSHAKLSGDRFIGAFVGNSWIENQWFIRNCYCLGKPYGATWKMPNLENVYSTEPGTGNLSILIANDIPSDFDHEIIMRFRCLRGKMFNSLNEKWTVSRMAKETNFGESHFQHLYKEIYSVPPITDLINERITRAKHLLTHETFEISKIATLLGYENATHFTRQFKKKVGISPELYRKNTSYK